MSTWSRRWCVSLDCTVLQVAFRWCICAGFLITAHTLLELCLASMGPYRWGSGNIFLCAILCHALGLLFNHFCSYVVRQPESSSWVWRCRAGLQSVLQLKLPAWVRAAVTVYRSIGFGRLTLLCHRSIGFSTVLTWCHAAFTRHQLC